MSSLFPRLSKRDVSDGEVGTIFQGRNSGFEDEEVMLFLLRHVMVKENFQID